MPEKRKFKLVDILALYFGRAIEGQQLQAVTQLYAFLTRSKPDNLPIHYLAAQKPLADQLKWLASVSVTYRDVSMPEPDENFRLKKITRREQDAKKRWIENLKKCHGEYVELEQFSPEDAKKVLEA